VDDTGASGSLAGGPIDDEGELGRAKTVIERGVFASVLSDRRSAALSKASHTGNGFRIPVLAESRAEAPVRVGFGHLDMAAGSTPRDALSRGKAILLPVLLGVHSANKATGAINNPVLGGVAMEDGVPVARLKAGTWSISANFFALLRELSGISAERQATGSALVPWIAGEVEVAG
jgi:predicted Zn-dependent protease